MPWHDPTHFPNLPIFFIPEFYPPLELALSEAKGGREQKSSFYSIFSSIGQKLGGYVIKKCKNLK